MKKSKYIKFSGPIIIEGPNSNGLVFDKDAMVNAVKEYKEKMIDTGRSFGELGIPEHLSCIGMKNVSHRITDLKIQDDRLIADIEVLSSYGNNVGTPMGDILQTLINSGTDQHRLN